MHSRLIVVANHTCPCPGLPDEVAALLRPDDARVHVVAPALNSRLRHWVSDVDRAVEQASERLRQAVSTLRACGLHADGSIGDADPLLAIEDTLAEFEADAVLLSTWPAEHSNWLERDLVARARARLDIPVEHVVSRYGMPATAAA